MNEHTSPTNLAELEHAKAIAAPDFINPKIRTMDVVDTDFHFSPTWASIRKHLKEPFKRLLHRFPKGSQEYSPEAAFEKERKGAKDRPVPETAADVLDIMDKFGTDTVILNPGYDRPQTLFNEPSITAIAAAHNDYLINEVFPVSDRIKANIMICQRDPQRGADEIRRVAHHPQFVGVYTSFGALFESIGTAKHDPILDAMQEHDLVLSSHTEGFFNHFTPLWTGSRTWVELFGNAPVGACMAHLAAMVMQGMFDKYPQQKVVFQEGGYWWLPDLMLRLDDFYLAAPGDIALVERKLEAGEQHLRKMPSEYILENVRFSTQPISIPKNRKHFAWLLEMCHADELFCFSSDWPHSTMEPANWVVENPDCIPEAMQRKILSGNARSLYTRL
jgi:predicted TIM-barrel fold metal-dependent hydrolase